jgi:hypothetical protein
MINILGDTSNIHVYKHTHAHTNICACIPSCIHTDMHCNQSKFIGMQEGDEQK